MGSKSPDYTGAAIAQGEANEDVVRSQTYANRPTQNTPWGQESWETTSMIDPASGKTVTGWTQNTTLDPALQEILNKQVGVQGQRSDLALQLGDRMQGEFGQAMDWSRFSPMASTPQMQATVAEGAVGGFDTSGLPGVGINQQTSLDYSGAPQVGNPYDTRQKAEDAMYNQAMSRLQPQFESERQQAEIKLRNQGLRPGDAAYDAQMASIGQRQTDATNQALWSSVGEGRAESGQMFGQQMGLRDQATGEQDRMGQFYNQANQNLYGMQSGLRGQLFGEGMGMANLFNQGAQQNFGQNLAANNQNFGQAMQAAQYANQIRQQQIAEAQGQRGQSLNEINALLSGQQVGMPQMPSFQPASVAQAAPIYQGTVDQGNYNAATSPWQAIGGLGGSLLGAAGAAKGFSNLFS